LIAHLFRYNLTTPAPSRLFEKGLPMSLRGLTPLVASLLAVSFAQGAAAQQSDFFSLFSKPRTPVAGHFKRKVALAKPKALPPRGAPPVEVITVPTFPMNDRTIDPETAAVRHALLTAGREGAFLDKRDALGVTEYYAEQGYALAWMSGGKLSNRGLAIIARIAEADTDGLNASAYHMPATDIGLSGPVGSVELAKADVMLSTAIVTYARQAYAGRIVPGKLSPNLGYEPHLPDPMEVLQSLTAADNPAATLASYNPPQKEYALLRRKLAELRRADPEKKVLIAAGPTLKPGMSDPRVLDLRKRFALPAANTAPEVYDAAVVVAVKAFQESAGLKADGVIAKSTLAAMNKPAVDPIPLVLANMERWRWMPRDLGQFDVRVNIPDFTLTVYAGDKIVPTTRVIVGKVDLQTPIFSDEIANIVVNPAWNVPSSIIAKEYLPLLRNGGYPKGFQVFAKVHGRFQAVDPGMVNWATVSANDLQFKQPPGERNALGVIKFNFPNKYAVYLHDTPLKALFEKGYRAFSHGCVRVQDPWGVADALFTQEQGLSVAGLKKLVGGPERTVVLARHIPVHITYFTAWVDDAGALQVRDDLYGHDTLVEAAMGLTNKT
jgi:L,D-transpeptidase YcbB